MRAIVWFYPFQILAVSCATSHSSLLLVLYLFRSLFFYFQPVVLNSFAYKDSFFSSPLSFRSSIVRQSPSFPHFSFRSSSLASRISNLPSRILQLPHRRRHINAFLRRPKSPNHHHHHHTTALIDRLLSLSLIHLPFPFVHQLSHNYVPVSTNNSVIPLLLSTSHLVHLLRFWIISHLSPLISHHFIPSLVS